MWFWNRDYALRFQFSLTITTNISLQQEISYFSLKPNKVSECPSGLWTFCKVFLNSNKWKPANFIFPPSSPQRHSQLRHNLKIWSSAQQTKTFLACRNNNYVAATDAFYRASPEALRNVSPFRWLGRYFGLFQQVGSAGRPRSLLFSLSRWSHSNR